MVVWTVKDDDGEIGYVVAFANSLQTANFQYECLSHRDVFDSVERAAPKSPKQAIKEENSAKMCAVSFSQFRRLDNSSAKKRRGGRKR